MEQVTITRVAVAEKNKDGVEYKTKEGKKFKRVSIQVDKYGEEWFTCLAFSPEDTVMNLQAGDEKILIFERGEFNNFKLPSRLDVLESRVAVLERAQQTAQKKTVYPEGYPTPEEEGIDVTKAGNW